MQKSVENFLEAADGANNVLNHARLLIKLAKFYPSLVPAYLVNASSIANYSNNVVFIHTQNNAVATKLMHLSSRIAEGFTKKGWLCNEVKIKVVLPKESHKKTIIQQKKLSCEAISELKNLHSSLSDSPLKEAVEAFINQEQE